MGQIDLVFPSCSPELSGGGVPRAPQASVDEHCPLSHLTAPSQDRNSELGRGGHTDSDLATICLTRKPLSLPLVTGGKMDFLVRLGTSQLLTNMNTHTQPDHSAT